MRSGQGQVIDAAMTDGSALLMAMLHGLRASGQWSGARGENTLDGGAHFYATYACSDGKRIAIGAIEPHFYQQLLAVAGIDDADFLEQWERTRWPRLKIKLAAVMATRTQSEWMRLFENTDACVAPVLDMTEAPEHPHNVARRTFFELGGLMQPAPAPRFSRTPSNLPRAQGTCLDATLESFGLASEVSRFCNA
jgi:alpha-methylacyl-CoA racemase